MEFSQAALEKAGKEFAEKQEGHGAEKTLMSLSWDLKELEDLNEEGRKLRVEVEALSDIADDESCDWVGNNIPRRLGKLRDRLTLFTKALSRHKRTAASHVFVFMIGTEDRTRKQYSLRIQCIPYKGLTDAKARQLADAIVSEMSTRGMKVAGFTTNGEFNSLRTKGRSRPTSVLQVKADVKAKYSRMKKKQMKGMLHPRRLPDGTVIADVQNPAVSPALLTEIMQWMEEGCGEEDIVERLRLRTVPDGYEYHTWQPDKTETHSQKMRDILAQLEYTWQMNDWHSRGVPFKEHLYIPEVHPATGFPFHEWEDDAHVFKRIATRIRKGGPREFQVQQLVEALNDASTGLTYTALSGVRSQSVEDAECLFGSGVIAFMERSGYTFEAKCLRIMRNWRRASDERGLSDLERSNFNHELLEFILDDLMPWHKDSDFSHLEVTRDVNRIRGLTREILVAVTMNLSSREWRSQFNHKNGIPPEHPRACQTDDVECFFSVLRDTVGKHFMLKQVFYGWRKVCVEFRKRLDPDLPFYYYTTAHERFVEGELPPFSEAAAKPRKERRAPRREQPAAQVGRRVTMVERGPGSIRAKFHNVPVALPPPPSRSETDHSYSASGP